MPEGQSYAIGSPFMDAMINDAARIAVKKAGGSMQLAVEYFYRMMDKIAHDATMSALNQQTQQRRKGAGQALKKEGSRQNIELRETKMANDAQIGQWRDDLIERGAKLNAVGALTAAGVKAYAGWKIANDAKDAKEGKSKGPKTKGDIAIDVAKHAITSKEQQAEVARRTESDTWAAEHGVPIEEIGQPLNRVDPTALPPPKPREYRTSTARPAPMDTPPPQPIAGALPTSGHVGSVVNANAQPSAAAVQGAEYQTGEHLKKKALAENELAASKGEAGMTPSTLADMFSDGELNKMVAGIMFPAGPYDDDELDSSWDQQWAEGMA